MTHWHDRMVDTPEMDGAVDAGWTISGLAVLGTIVVVWAFGDLDPHEAADAAKEGDTPTRYPVSSGTNLKTRTRLPLSLDDVHG